PEGRLKVMVAELPSVTSAGPVIVIVLLPVASMMFTDVFAVTSTSNTSASAVISSNSFGSITLSVVAVTSKDTSLLLAGIVTVGGKVYSVEPATVLVPAASCTGIASDVVMPEGRRTHTLIVLPSVTVVASGVMLICLGLVASVIVIVVPVTVKPVEVPSSTKVSSRSRMLSSVAVSVVLPEVCVAAIVIWF